MSHLQFYRGCWQNWSKTRRRWCFSVRLVLFVVWAWRRRFYCSISCIHRKNTGCFASCLGLVGLKLCSLSQLSRIIARDCSLGHSMISNLKCWRDWKVLSFCHVCRLLTDAYPRKYGRENEATRDCLCWKYMLSERFHVAIRLTR